MNRFLNYLQKLRSGFVNDAHSRHELFLFVHIPKTGGQSLRSFFAKNLVPHQTFIHLLAPDNVGRHMGSLLSDFAQRPVDERMRARVILGHIVNKDTHKLVPGKTPRHVLFLREPAETLVSSYNFRMKLRRAKEQPLITFEEWYDKSKQGNMMTRWLLTHFMMEPYPPQMTRRELKQVQAMLHTFWFVGCTEFLDRDAPLLFQRMGLAGVLQRANVSGIHHQKTLTLDTALRERLRAENPLDVELYEYWKARLDKTRAKTRAALAERSETRPVSEQQPDRIHQL